MDKIIFIKKNDGDDDELSCVDCVFYDACRLSGGEMLMMLECVHGDYWVIEE